MNPLWYLLPVAFALLGVAAHFVEHAMGEYVARKHPEQNILINVLIGNMAGILLLLIVLATTTKDTP